MCVVCFSYLKSSQNLKKYLSDRPLWFSCSRLFGVDDCGIVNLTICQTNQTKSIMGHRRTKVTTVFRMRTCKLARRALGFGKRHHFKHKFDWVLQRIGHPLKSLTRFCMNLRNLFLELDMCEMSRMGPKSNLYLVGDMLASRRTSPLLVWL